MNIVPVNTHTVIFNEESTDSFQQFMIQNKPLDVNAEDLHDTLCSHESIDNLKYVSLKGAYPWSPGSMMYWGGKILHASDNFLANGLMEKQALVLFTTIN